MIYLISFYFYLRGFTGSPNGRFFCFHTLFMLYLILSFASFSPLVSELHTLCRLRYYSNDEIDSISTDFTELATSHSFRTILSLWKLILTYFLKLKYFYTNFEQPWKFYLTFVSEFRKPTYQKAYWRKIWREKRGQTKPSAQRKSKYSFSHPLRSKFSDSC